MLDAVQDLELPSETLCNSRGEQALLGALIYKPSCVQYVPATFKPEHFGIEWHPELYEAILACNADGNGDLMSVTRAWALGAPDKIAYLGQLSDAIVGYSRGVIANYCENITDLWRRRQVLEIARELLRTASTPSSILTSEALLSRGISDLERVAGAAPAGREGVMLHQAIRAAVEAGEKAASGQYNALSTGMPTVDRALNGLENGCLYILAARPGMGKTALALEWAISIARAGTGVLIVSLEMQSVQLGRRAVSFMADINAYAVRYGKWNADDAEAIIQVERDAAKMPLTIEDEPGQSTAMIALKARAAQRKHGLGCIIVDHLHIVETDASNGRMGETWLVGKVSNDLKRLAKKLDVPIIALAQLNRGPENRDDKRPTMADLRQAGNIEQDADAVMFIYRPEYYLGKSEPEQNEGETDAKYEQRVAAWRTAKDRTAGKAELILAKVRENEPTMVPLMFDGAKTSFREID